MTELDSEGRVLKKFPPRPVRRVVSADTAREVIKGMQRVVEWDGTGNKAWIYDYDVAGKTGTAQKPDMIAGGYAEDRWIASFVGLVPAARPRLAILVAVDEPRGLYYGGHVAAPVFREIAEWSLNYLGVPPSYGSRETVRAQYVKAQGEPDVTAEGAYYDYPEGVRPGVNPAEPEMVKVPDFTDMSLRSAVASAHESFLAVDVDGSGLAAGQSIKAGTEVVPWTRVSVYFRPEGGEGP
jgi:membrane peptidoglycan carboxypeptidase